MQSSRVSLIIVGFSICLLFITGCQSRYAKWHDEIIYRQVALAKENGDMTSLQKLFFKTIVDNKGWSPIECDGKVVFPLVDCYRIDSCNLQNKTEQSTCYQPN